MKKIVMTVCAVCFFSGCAAIQKAPVAIATYDFSQQSASHQNPKTFQTQKKSLLITDATVPTWLDSTAIHYRLRYHNPAQSYSYASSRWIAPPAAMLTSKIRDRIITDTQGQVIKSNTIANADYTLHIDLDELVQVFDTPDDSHGMIAIRVSLIERSTRRILAQSDFKAQQESSSANAEGAVFALSAASDQLIDELIEWLALQLPPNAAPAKRHH
ncbi:hypothetical protein ABF87_01865 [Nitrosomonas sp. JL21]|uniref:ABC-type transport auxiliary lipoprotein family protein n=1 Tax=Nitrosomonas sp. JL21 TaxID=153949 RepID=UPI0013698141|nr:ABC-type transport auxiliary lipoprotein family protein [Nitrosomonas sp. JL21]MBL8498939.1 membrane integrity-associated transporter subunit PqiC [Nitrosomonas sp.]MCC7092435.1 membrane integrity-associated transporter subunit PqiC [Nitrosomonas sp.]MXS76723.1 hypothetical protein [Nitrosomonas sp. JL21]